MNAEQILYELRKMRQTPEELPKWPFSEEVIRCLTYDPQATAKYIEERMTKTFHDREGIGKHFDAYMQASGITRGNLILVNLKLGLQTKPTQKTLDRAKERERLKKEALKVLDAVVDVIENLGKTYAMSHIAQRHDIPERRLYNNTHKHLAKHEVEFADLKRIRHPQRKALAKRVKTDEMAHIAEKYRE